MTSRFIKYPSTPYLIAWGSETLRDDKVMSRLECEDFLRNELIIEEKIDGANLGISFDSDGTIRLQNRGDYLYEPLQGQWINLPAWLNMRMNSLFEHLTDRYILFGEWCYACHSVYYSKLPDWFLAYDIYDRYEDSFLIVSDRNDVVTNMGLYIVPIIYRGKVSISDLESMIGISWVGDELAEGLYLRCENEANLVGRAKVVRREFSQDIDNHWTKTGIRTNRLKYI